MDPETYTLPKQHTSPFRARLLITNHARMAATLTDTLRMADMEMKNL
jgi:hypothetical protein